MIAMEHYTIREPLHLGSRYAIYRGTHIQTQNSVILKVNRFEQPSLTDVAALEHEYQLLKQLNLPGIIKAYELVKQQHKAILVLEDIHGQSLHKYLAGQPLSLDVFFKIALQLIDALAGLHLNNIIHKDINPFNMIIHPASLTVKLANFNIASKINEIATGYVPANRLEGTLTYFSPEQTGRMNRTIDYRSDFYSLGLTFFELLTGHPPFYSPDALEMLHCHIAQVPPLVSEVNPEVPYPIAAIIEKLLAKTAEERYASATGLKFDLVECQKQRQAQSMITPFPLGQHDNHDRLNLTHKLYGREEQITALLKIFERASQNNAELLLIKGYSGIGKSSLVKEIHKPLVRQKAYFICGKYEQLQRTTPYSAIISAFESLVKQILVEHEDYILTIKQKLLTVLGNNGQVIINIVPSVELLIGPQPPVPELESGEAQNRFMLKFQQFIQALVGPDHPLVLFLDDLQWIDNASLELIKTIMTDHQLKYFLLIGAYRDNEVLPEHPLSVALHEIKQIKTLVNYISLPPLNSCHIQLLLKDNLNTSMIKTEALAELLYQKTHGNPFFINEFLKNLYQNKLIYFSYDSKKWVWNIKKIRQQTITKNVVDLLIQRISQLSESVQYMLQLAACIGQNFDLKTLSIISEKSFYQTTKILWQAVESGFIVPISQSQHLLDGLTKEISAEFYEQVQYSFTHDKIQQAAYKFIPEESKEQVHLKIGQLLLKESGLSTSNFDESMFDILNHFNHSLNLLENQDEKLIIAELNILAGSKARASIAYESAHIYLKSAETLLATVEKSDKVLALSFEMNKEIAECYFQLNKFEQAEKYIKILLDKSIDKVSKGKIRLIQIRAYITAAKHYEAILLGIQALNEFGVKLPSRAKVVHVLWEIVKLKVITKLLKRNRSRIEAKDIEILMVNQIFSAIIPASFLVDQNLFAIISCRLISMAHKKGYTSETSFACRVYAFILISQFSQIKEAFDFVEFSDFLDERLVNRQQSRKCFGYGFFIGYWKYPYRQTVEYLLKGYQVGLEEGDFAYAGYNLLSNLFLFYLGESLPEIELKIGNSIPFLKKAGTHDWHDFFILFKNVVMALRNKDQLLLENFEPILNQIEKCQTKTVIAYAHNIYSQIHYFYGNYDKALTHSTMSYALADFTKGTLDEIFEYLFHGLCIAAYYPKLDHTKQKKYKKTLYKIQAKFKRWSQWYPENFMYAYYLLSAEIAFIENGFNTKSISLYNQAIEQAIKLNFINFVAIANECAARFYLSSNNIYSAKAHLQNAHYAYHQWGAYAKCELLRQKYPEWLHHYADASTDEKAVVNGDNVLANIDILSILKFTQAISIEIQLDKLLQKLLVVVLQNAGAQRGVLLNNYNNSWYVEAEGNNIEQLVYLAPTELAQNRADLPLSLIQFVNRTQEPLIIQSAHELENITSEDQYLNEVKPQSLLLLPIHYQGQLKSLLYLENKVLRYAFTPEHIQTVKLLASQAAISLENARLYYQATHDPLTGLANRNLLYQAFNLITQQAKVHSIQLAVLFFDLDGFKYINDSLGHEIGDKLLQHVANQLSLFIKKGDLAVRLGGDEFVILLNHSQPEIEAIQIANRLLKQLKQPILIEGHSILIDSSIGISLYPEHSENIDTLLKQADIALYQVKAHGKGYYQLYKNELNQQLINQYHGDIELQKAIEKQEFMMFYQPVYSATSQKILYFEALLRWQHSERGLLEAKDFISYSEKNGLIVVLGEWIINNVCQQLQQWQQAGLKPVPVAINVSGVQFKKQILSDILKRALEQRSIPAKFIKIEITESVFIEQTEQIIEDIKTLKNMGIELIIDDFGTYYSSLNYLKRFDVSAVKMDQSFVHDIENDEQNRVLITSIISMAQCLKLSVVGEGVETQSQLDFLKQQGIDAVQGYYLSYPLNAADCTRLLAKKIFTS